MGGSRRIALAWSAAVLAFVGGCGVAGTGSVATDYSVSSTATGTTTSTTRPTPPTPTVTVTATVTTPEDNSLEVAPTDFTSFRDLNFAARWNDSTTDPDLDADCDALSDDHTYCWSAQVWNGNVACPSRVRVDIDIYDGTVGATGSKVGDDFGISLAQNIQPYSITRVLIFTDTTSPSGHATATITSIQCSLV